MEEVCRGQVPSTIQLFESFEDEHCFFTVTRYLPEGNLLVYLAKQEKMCPITEDTIKLIIWQLVEAVHGLHKRDILHRDIKMTNVLVSDSEDPMQVQLADFGSSVRLNPLTGKTTRKIGTPGYIAPEMLVDERGYGLHYDVWSLGALMFALFTGQVPFWSENRQEREARVCSEPLNTSNDHLLRQASSEARHLLHSMLAKDPQDRHTILEVAEHPWFDDFNEGDFNDSQGQHELLDSI